MGRHQQFVVLPEEKLIGHPGDVVANDAVARLAESLAERAWFQPNAETNENPGGYPRR